MKMQYHAIVKNGTWCLTNLLDGKKAIDTKWVEI